MLVSLTTVGATGELPGGDDLTGPALEVNRDVKTVSAVCPRARRLFSPRTRTRTRTRAQWFLERGEPCCKQFTSVVVARLVYQQSCPMC